MSPNPHSYMRHNVCSFLSTHPLPFNGNSIPPLPSITLLYGRLECDASNSIGTSLGVTSEAGTILINQSSQLCRAIIHPVCDMVCGCLSTILDRDYFQFVPLISQCNSSAHTSRCGHGQRLTNDLSSVSRSLAPLRAQISEISVRLTVSI